MVTFYRRLPEFEYLASKTIDEALSLLSQYKEKARLIASSTDVIPQSKIMRARAKKVQGEPTSNLDGNPQGFILYSDFCIEEAK